MTAAQPSPVTPKISPDIPAAVSLEMPPREVLDAADMARALTRIAHEILEPTKGGNDVLLLGIPTRGVGLAHRLARQMSAVEKREVLVGSLDITMYRDDLRL